MNCKPSVICLSETWCQTTSPIASQLGYNHVNLPRLNRKGRGVCMYISNHVRFTVVNMSIKFCTFEHLAILIKINTKQVLCVTVYNPSSSACDFYGEFTVLFENLGKMFSITDYYIAGDFNIDLLSKCSESKELTALLLSVNAYPTIYHPTRVTKTSSILMDNIL